ncbi:MAG: hypothetical protein EOO20_18100 [Chryseobacterium sp.]|nr:MAG: hypothetical protein EOO20_18100 [Chryseobacterium sp.]
MSTNYSPSHLDAVNENTNERPSLDSGYILAAAVALIGFSLLIKGKKNDKPGFIAQYITPLIMAAAYKKVLEVFEKDKAPTSRTALQAREEPVK